MSNGISGNYYDPNKNDYNKNKETCNFNDSSLNLDNIDSLFATEIVDKKRTTFDETFTNNIEIDDVADTDGEKFLDSLQENKDDLMKKLGLSEGEYENLACIALALASQETGMGLEKGYAGENTGVGNFFRKILKWWDVNVEHNGSASSGLTQMKIYDFMNGDKLTNEQKEILKEYGITADGIATDNLFKNPDKSAVATMVVLTSLYENYDNYQKLLNDKHDELEKTLGLTTENKKIEAEKKGEEILNNFTTFYEGISTSDGKSEVRQALKDWLIAAPNEKKKSLNEEHCLNELNKKLEKYSAGFTLSQSDLNYIRYELTTQAAAMNEKEYCAYAWNKGTGENGMKLDRILSDTLGTILKDPEDLDYLQFTVNVSTLAEKYAEQARQ